VKNIVSMIINAGLLLGYFSVASELVPETPRKFHFVGGILLRATKSVKQRNEKGDQGRLFHLTNQR
jgi:hypothetical protein